MVGDINKDTKTEIRGLLGKSSVEYLTVESDRAIRTKIINSYNDFVIRLYCTIRFHIINSRFLETIEQHIPTHGRVLDVGCGFGLFSCYFAMKYPTRHISGFDISESRIEEANLVARKLGLDNANFTVADARTHIFDYELDAAIMLDILHHIGREKAEELVKAAYDNLSDDGVLIVKDISARPFHKMFFTYMLDKVMDFARPVHYRDVNSWKKFFARVGFKKVYTYYLDDYLPYSHILFVCYKGNLEHR